MNKFISDAVNQCWFFGFPSRCKWENVSVVYIRHDFQYCRHNFWGKLKIVPNVLIFLVKVLEVGMIESHILHFTLKCHNMFPLNSSSNLELRHSAY